MGLSSCQRFEARGYDYSNWMRRELNVERKSTTQVKSPSGSGIFRKISLYIDCKSFADSSASGERDKGSCSGVEQCLLSSMSTEDDDTRKL